MQQIYHGSIAVVAVVDVVLSGVVCVVGVGVGVGVGLVVLVVVWLRDATNLPWCC